MEAHMRRVALAPWGLVATATPTLVEGSAVASLAALGAMWWAGFTNNEVHPVITQLLAVLGNRGVGGDGGTRSDWLNWLPYGDDVFDNFELLASLWVCPVWLLQVTFWEWHLSVREWFPAHFGRVYLLRQEFVPFWKCCQQHHRLWFWYLWPHLTLNKSCAHKFRVQSGCKLRWCALSAPPHVLGISWLSFLNWAYFSETVVASRV